MIKPLQTPRILRELKQGLGKVVMAISIEESEQLLLALWEINHRGEEDQMQFRVMIDELNDLIEVGV